jgi:hypothetical protein
MYYFKRFPKIFYDIEKNGKPVIIKNIALRFKLLDIIQSKTALYYDYTIQDGERPDIVADKYYGSPTKDWLIFLVNNIIDPQWDWPMSSQQLKRYVIKKYGSLSAATNESDDSAIHHYERILQPQERLFDGTVVPERTVIIDKTTYDDVSLLASEKRKVTYYTYEVNKNNVKSQIKLLDKRYQSSFLRQMESELQSLPSVN